MTNTIEVVIRAVDQASDALRQVSRNVGAFGQDIDRNAGTPLRNLSSALDSIGSRVSQLGQRMQTAGAGLSVLTAPLVAFGVDGVRTAANFEAALAEIGARSQLTSDQLLQLRDYALQLGQDTAFSGQQVLDAFLQLTTGGLSFQEAWETIPAVLDGAAASGASLGSTADGLTNVLKMFRLPTTQARRAIDVFAKTAGASSITIEELFAGFANIGPVADQFGLSFEDTAAILATFREVGIDGAEAGTQLKSMLLNMTRPVDEVGQAWERLGVSLRDSDGTMRPLNTVIEEMAAAMAGMNDQARDDIMQTLAGSYGIVGLQALLAAGGFDEMLAAMDDATDAATVAETRMDTFNGSMDALGGSVEALKTKAFDPFMRDVLRPLAEELTTQINKMADWAEQNPETAQTIISLVGAAALLGGGLFILGTVVNVAGAAISALGAGIGLLTSGALLPLLPVLAIGAALVFAYQNNILGFKNAVDAAFGAVTNLVEIMKALNGQMGETGVVAAANAISNELNPNDRRPGIIWDAGRRQWIDSTTGMPSIVQYPAPPGRAIGGPVAGGGAYMVGEQGPEMFIPASAGRIVPNDELGGGSYYTINVMMPAAALASPGAANAAGETFGDAIARRLRELG